MAEHLFEMMTMTVLRDKKSFYGMKLLSDFKNKNNILGFGNENSSIPNNTDDMGKERVSMYSYTDSYIINIKGTELVLLKETVSNNFYILFPMKNNEEPTLIPIQRETGDRLLNKLKILDAKKEYEAQEELKKLLK